MKQDCFIVCMVSSRSCHEMFLICTAVIIAAISSPTSASDNGLALTPPMGWISWLCYGCDTECEHGNPFQCLSEDVISSVTEDLISLGYKKVGYEYVIIDDCWLEKEREDGKLVADKKRFKTGMKALANFIQEMGMKFGMYEDIGRSTCQGYPGLKGHEKVDVATFVDWQIDYLKVDGCYEKPENMNISYPAFGKLLNESGRPIVYSCSWPAYISGKEDYDAISKTCNLWRNYNDIDATWDSVKNIMEWFGSQPELAKYAGPGHFHDPDMLVIGFPGISVDVARIQMAVWSVLAAPLLISAHVYHIPFEQRAILQNKDIIAVDQCPCGKMGSRINSTDTLDIWKREYKLGIAIAMVNKGSKSLTVLVSHSDLKLDNVDLNVMDFYKDDDDQVFKKDSHLNVTINGPGVKFYRFTPAKGVWKIEGCPQVVDVTANDISMI